LSGVKSRTFGWQEGDNTRPSIQTARTNARIQKVLTLGQALVLSAGISPAAVLTRCRFNFHVMILLLIVLVSIHIHLVIFFRVAIDGGRSHRTG
jgi:hypothetical protein